MSRMISSPSLRSISGDSVSLAESPKVGKPCAAAGSGTSAPAQVVAITASATKRVNMRGRSRIFEE